jgi:hypothetical protein
VVWWGRERERVYKPLSLFFLHNPSRCAPTLSSKNPTEKAGTERRKGRCCRPPKEKFGGRSGPRCPVLWAEKKVKARGEGPPSFLPSPSPIALEKHKQALRIPKRIQVFPTRRLAPQERGGNAVVMFFLCIKANISPAREHPFFSLFSRPSCAPSGLSFG